MKTTGLSNVGAITDWVECKRVAQKVWPHAGAPICNPRSTSQDCIREFNNTNFTSTTTTTTTAISLPPVLGCYHQGGRIHFNDVYTRLKHNWYQCSPCQECLSVVGRGLVVGTYGMVWYGMAWYGMSWYGVIWYRMEEVWKGSATRTLLVEQLQCWGRVS